MVPTIHALDTYGCRRVALQDRGGTAAAERLGERVWGREVKMFQMSGLGMLGDSSLKIANPPGLLTHLLAQFLEVLCIGGCWLFTRLILASQRRSRRSSRHGSECGLTTLVRLANRGLRSAHHDPR